MGKESACNAGDEADAGSVPRSGNPLEEEMTIDSRIFAWRIPWEEEPGELQSIRLQREGCNYNNVACMQVLRNKVTGIL